MIHSAKMPFLMCAFVMATLLAIGGCSDDASEGNDTGDTADSNGIETGTATDSTDSGDGNPTDDETDSDDCIAHVDCTGRCGKLTDSCTGEEYNCGGCEVGKICDIFTNNCQDPLITCEDLGATCGTTRNSCGVRLFCGDCPSGEECDKNTNTCTKCTEPSCQDLGIQCGTTWNGCGDRNDSDNEMECGDCEGDMVCNPNYKVCEPNCTPDDAAQICLDAQLDQGVECGWISDGCGGIVNCGSDACLEGQSCGIRGVANRCDYPERPVECTVAGWECGTFDSVCGDSLDCGDCLEDGHICRDNHTCGPPCAPHTCETAYGGQCGQQLDDGCDGTIDCGCAEGLTCNTLLPGDTGTCEVMNTCDDYTTRLEGQPCSNAPADAFPRGDGVNLTCECRNWMDCVDGMNVVTGNQVGECCQSSESCQPGPNQPCTATNSCTGEVSQCCHAATQYCTGGTCVNRLVCSEISYSGRFADGTAGAPCSDGGNAIFDDGSGDKIVCGCNGGLVCVDGDGDTPGWCCENTATCEGNVCSVVNTCDGTVIDCCSGCCEDDICVAARRCSDYTDRNEGDPCSTNNFFDRCDPDSPDHRLLRCGCGSGLCCSQPDSNSAGTCLANPGCDGSSCTYVNPCTLEEENCCGADEYCDAGTDTCHSLATCSDFTARGEGDPCSDVASQAFPAGDGTFLQCGCQTGSGWANLTCNGDSETAAGTCECTPRTCHCGNTGSSDGCGGTLTCPCDGDQVCDTSVSPPACCDPYVCPSGPGGECGIVHTQCGQNVECGCPDPYEECGGGGEDNICGCTPINPCVGQTGPQPDGCGGTVICQG